MIQKVIHFFDILCFLIFQKRQENKECCFCLVCQVHTLNVEGMQKHRISEKHKEVRNMMRFCCFELILRGGGYFCLAEMEKKECLER